MAPSGRPWLPLPRACPGGGLVCLVVRGHGAWPGLGPILAWRPPPRQPDPGSLALVQAHGPASPFRRAHGALARPGAAPPLGVLFPPLGAPAARPPPLSVLSLLGVPPPAPVQPCPSAAPLARPRPLHRRGRGAPAPARGAARRVNPAWRSPLTPVRPPLPGLVPRPGAASSRCGPAPCARGHGVPMARPPSLCAVPPPARCGAPTQRGPGPTRLRLARPRCPCVARPPAHGSAPACARLVRGASARPCVRACSCGARGALARLVVPSARRVARCHVRDVPATPSHPSTPPHVFYAR
jgi:hypothetical protein